METFLDSRFSHNWVAYEDFLGFFSHTAPVPGSGKPAALGSDTPLDFSLECTQPVQLAPSTSSLKSSWDSLTSPSNSTGLVLAVKIVRPAQPMLSPLPQWTEIIVCVVFILQKQLVIQGKNVVMQYSTPRQKFEDWLCNTVSTCFYPNYHAGSIARYLCTNRFWVHPLHVLQITAFDFIYLFYLSCGWKNMHSKDCFQDGVPLRL